MNWLIELRHIIDWFCLCSVLSVRSFKPYFLVAVVVFTRMAFIRILAICYVRFSTVAQRMGTIFNTMWCVPHSTFSWTMSMGTMYSEKLSQIISSYFMYIQFIQYTQWSVRRKRALCRVRYVSHTFECNIFFFISSDTLRSQSILWNKHILCNRKVNQAGLMSRDSISSTLSKNWSLKLSYSFIFLINAPHMISRWIKCWAQPAF